MSGATAAACARPASSRGTSACPCARPTWFHSVRPWRSRTSIRAAGLVSSGTATAAGHTRRQLDQRAVAPEPLQCVEGALLLVLHVDDDLAVVEQHPSALALTFPAYRFRAVLSQ